MRFSQRMGLRPVKAVLQVDSIDELLMNRLWNTFIENFYNSISDHAFDGDSDRGFICKLIWTEFFGKRIDLIPSMGSGRVFADGVLDHIEDWFFNQAIWYEIYDFIEEISKIEVHSNSNCGFTEKCNRAFKKELSGYRIINGTVAQITTEEEIISIEEALDSSDEFKTTKTHLTTALKLLSDKQSPDYRNSIKESISAVEAFCRIIAKDDKASFATALAIIEKKHQLHSSLKQAYIKIYGYTSDANGIRHPLLDDGLTLEFEDAKFMLVSCSSFINYLKTKLKL
jgi:hypothetical protein